MEVYLNGDVFVGMFAKNARSGKGHLRRKNGEQYVGEWYQGMRHGYGQWTCEGSESSNATDRGWHIARRRRPPLRRGKGGSSGRSNHSSSGGNQSGRGRVRGEAADAQEQHPDAA